MSKYRLTIEGDFEICECEKCTVGVVFGGNDKCFKINKYSCPLEEVKQGEWDEECQCTTCGWYGEDRYKRDAVWFHFCPNCGTPMKGGK